MNILIACSEAVPYVKTGGLADVTGALVRELRRRKHQASLILPLYQSIRPNVRLRNTGKTVRVPVGNALFEGAIFCTGTGRAPEAYFIDCSQFYDRPELYGTSQGEYGDNAVRFIFFNRAVLEACLQLGLEPDLIHCHDWQTGLIPLYLKSLYGRHRQFLQTATLFTIHNLGYQGNFDPSNLPLTGLGWDYFVPERLEFYGALSFMKAGLLYADLLNTVSGRYSREILEPSQGFGMDGVLRGRAEDLSGIVNGLDYHEWNPETDPHLPHTYSSERLRGKAACRQRLVAQAGFPDSAAPVMGVVSRLSHQKGMDILVQALDELIRLGATIVILGRGEAHYERLLKEKAREHKGRLYLHVGFEEPLAHLIYAGSDFFLMPSRYEPCGIGQLIALKYGALPVARRTGGLADTIVDFDHLSGSGTGFLFDDYAPEALLAAAKRAFCLYSDARKMKAAAVQAMAQDFSWSRAASDYLDLYERAAQRRRR